MNIGQGGVCPFGHGKSISTTTESAPGAAQPKVAPKDDGKFTIDDIICPFQRAAYNEGVLKADVDGNVTNLPEVLKKFAGAGSAITAVAHHAAKKLTAGGDLAAFKADSYNLQDLEGSSLDHAADTGILRGGFHQERLDEALSFSSDGERLTLADLHAFQEANLKKEPGLHGKLFGGAEFALLVKTFGRVDAHGTCFIRNKDFERLYKEAKWPEDWEPPKPASLGFLSTGLAVREYFVSGDDRAAAAMAAPPKTSGACPFLSGQSFDMDEAAKQHSEMLP